MYEDNNNQYPNYYGTYSGSAEHLNVETPISPIETASAPNKGKRKKGFLGTILKFAVAGTVFGACAGCVMVILLNLAPVNSTQENGGGVVTQDNRGNAIANKDKVGDAKEISAVNISGNTVVSDVSAVVENTMPSVVSIAGMYKVEQNNYFGFYGFTTESESPGSGSGIIVGQNDTELLVATNNHVVEDATSLSVQFIDSTTADAVVKGTNADVDLAVIAISLEDLSEDTKSAIKVAALGDSDSLKVGEPAIAIGNALGYGQSVTTGVISAANREYTIEDNTAYLIQTDAAINPGNSGGALLNAQGQVIGINSSKIGGSVIEGMGYAIPISTAKPIIEELMAKTTRVKVEEAKKAYLGIVGISVTKEVQEAYGLPEGVYVTQVFQNTGADKAGIVKGDIIISFDGEKVSTMEELSSLLECYEQGTTVEIKLMQGSPTGYQEKTITATLGGRVDS